MKKVEGIIERALQAQVALYLKQGKLAYTAADGALSDELRAEIAAHKGDIIAYLGAMAAATDADAGTWPLDAAPDAEGLPLSLQQQQVWLGHTISEQGQYNITNTFDMRGPLDHDALRRTLDVIVERHAILRTLYAPGEDGGVVQRVVDATRFQLHVIDLSWLNDAGQQKELSARLATERSRRFDLGHDLPLRVACFICSSGRHVLSITIHHIASDGWSQALLVAEICAVYEALRAGIAPRLPPLSLSYGDYAYSQRRALAQGRFAQELAYWRATLDGVPSEPLLPTDLARPPVFVASGATVESRLDAGDLTRLSTLAKQHNMTLFMLMQAILALMIGRWADRDDVVIGTPISGRDREATHGIVGLFVNVLPLRTRCPAQGPLATYLAQSRERTLQALSMQALPLGYLLQSLDIEQSMGHSPLFQTVFNLQNAVDAAPNLGEVALSALAQPPLIKYDLEIVALQDADGLTLSWKYADRLFLAGTVQMLADACLAALRQLAAGDVEDVAALEFPGLVPRTTRIGDGPEDALRQALAIAQDAFPGCPLAWIRQGGSAAPRHVLHLLADAAPDAQALRQRQLAVERQVAATLGQDWVPHAWSLVGAECLRGAGRLDRRKLPTVHFPLETEAQRRVAAVWSEMLECPGLGVTDDFFDRGGNSIKAMRATSRLSELCSVEMQIRDIFEHTVLADYALVLEARGLGKRPLIPVRPAGARMALSFAQERVWFIDQLNGGSPEYNMPALFQLTGTLDLDLAERAMGLVIQRHEVLRSVYATDDDGVVQRVLEQERFHVLRHDLAALPPGEREPRLARLIQEELTRPFNLAQDLMVRATYFDTGCDGAGHAQGVLLFNVHHIACDGWSQDLLVNEFVVAYRHLAQGGAAPASLSIQYADYAHWQRRWMGSDAFERQLQYWLTQLADAPPVHGLRLDRPRPEGKAHVGSSIISRVQAAEAAALERLAKHFQLTPFMLTHAALALVLDRHSHAGEVLIGTPVANRHQAQTEQLIGFFINTLVLRLTTAHATLGDLLAEVRQVHLDAQSNQDIPFELLVDRLQVQRTPKHTPLFQIMLSADADYGLKRGDERALLEVPGAQVRTYAFEGTGVKFDIEIHSRWSPDGASVSWTYDHSIFDRASIERLDAHLHQIFGALARLAQDADAAGATPLRQLDVLPATQRRRVVEEFNPAWVEHARLRPVHHAIAAQARATPDAPAVIAGHTRLSYATLERLANQLAHRLVAAGVTPESRVALCIERGPEMVVAVLAVLKSGGAYVPLDPGAPAARLHAQLNDCQPVLMLTRSSLAQALHDAPCPVLPLDGAAAADIAGLPEDEPVVPGVTLGTAAYVIYTSGSTGMPKGVVVEHGGLANYLHWAVDHYAGNARIDAVVSTPLVFDATVTSLFVPLLVGGALTLLPQGQEVVELERHLLAAPAPCLVKITPAHLAVLGHGLQEDSCPPHLFVVGGEALPSATVARWRAVSPASRIVNEYGPTETVVGCTAFSATDWLGHADTVPIGRPIANASIYVLDALGEPVPVGVAGELHIGGAGVARGYLNQPALTAERFVLDPFSARPEARMYRSGDVARWLDDGVLEFLGRNDDQLKIRGVRIEPGEIEAAARHCAEIAEAAVVTRELVSGGGLDLVLYVVLRPGAALDATALKEALSSRLPAYMLPAAIVFLPALPLTGNGKLDRAALPLPVPAPDADRQSPPRSEIEHMLHRVWQGLLPHAVFGCEQDFFAVGGNSLLLARLQSRIRAECEVAVPVGTLFAHRSIAAQARIIERFLAVAKAEESLDEDIVEEEI
jgi:amino acid adenylation domain-containing protein